MRLDPRRFALALLAALWAPAAMAAGQAAVATTRLEVVAGTHVQDLACPWRHKAARAPAPADPDPPEMPNEEDVRSELQEMPGRRAPSSHRQLPPFDIGPDGTFKVAIWGDSHLAAGFFNEELVRQLGLGGGKARPGLLPANMNRAGVRLPLRASCVSPHWRYEAAYAKASGAESPGPGLVNLVSGDANAELRFDLRNAQGVPESRVARLLYQRTQAPLRLAVSIDDAPETEVALDGAPGPAALELAADAALSVVRVRLIEGHFRFHGLELPPAVKPALQIDVFGYPGATVAGWKSANMDYLSAWFARDAYHLVMLEYGTNEGNASPFDAAGYAQVLRAAVAHLRTAFPAAACLLIAPGDRGVLVRRSAKLRHKAGAPGSTPPHKAKGKASARSAAKPRGQPAGPVAAAGLLKYSLVHEDIARIQQEVASESGCQVWSAFDAMGGRGSAYAWAREKPALMAPDLIHFTVKGYQRLAQEFAASLEWNAARIWGRPVQTLPTR